MIAMLPIAESPFERGFIATVESMALRLPLDAGSLMVGRVPGHEEWRNPYFEIVPTNPRAARISGWAAVSDLNITIGQMGDREFIGFGRGATILKDASPREELEAICSAVMKGGFTEHLAFNSRGKLLYSEILITISGTTLSFGVTPWLGIRWPARSIRDITYESYGEGIQIMSSEHGG